MISKLVRIFGSALLLSTFSLQAVCAVQFVHTVGTGSFTSDSSGNPASFSLVVASPAAVGDVVVMQIVFSGLPSGPLLNQTRDTRSNVYFLENRLSSGFGAAFQVYDLAGTITTALAPGDLITISMVPASSNPYTALASAQEFSGVSTVQDGIEVTSGGNGFATTFDTVSSSGPLVTTNADDLIYGFVVAQSSSVSGVNYASSNPVFTSTQQVQSSGISIFPIYSAVTSPGSFGVSGNIQVTGNAPVFTVFLRALKAAAVTTAPTSILSLQKTHVGNFQQGQHAANYQLTVTNNGTVNSVDPITIEDTLPVGLTFDSAVAPGWTCSAAGQTVACSSSTVSLAASETTTISLAVDVSSNAAASVTNQASVSCGSPCTTSGNPATDPTIIEPQSTVIPPAQNPTPATALGSTSLLLMIVAIVSVVCVKQRRLTARR